MKFLLLFSFLLLSCSSSPSDPETERFWRRLEGKYSPIDICEQIETRRKEKVKNKVKHIKRKGKRKEKGKKYKSW